MFMYERIILQLVENSMRVENKCESARDRAATIGFGMKLSQSYPATLLFACPVSPGGILRDTAVFSKADCKAMFVCSYGIDKV